MTLRLLRTFILSLLISQASHAFEIQPSVGSLTHQRVDGCCISTGNKTGFGLLVRTDTKNAGTWDFLGYSDRNWSEFAVLKPLQLMGEARRYDPSPDGNIRIQRTKNWDAILSYGAGYFVHSTRTTAFNLPTNSSGISLTTQTHVAYNWNDQYAVVGTFHLGLGLGIDNKGYLWGTFLGLRYRPSK
jgi:hypothetical protein